MWKRTISQAALWLTISGVFSPTYALTQEELVTLLRHIKSTAEGTTAKAIKNGKEVRLVVDSTGHVKEQN